MTSRDRRHRGLPPPRSSRPSASGRPCHEEATAPLTEAGWRRDPAQHERARHTPNRQAVVVSSARGAPDPGGTNWFLAARPANDNAFLWQATAHSHTPNHLIRALCTALAVPTPVPRQHRPVPGAGATVIRP
ncbi:DUF317 domain-containing protein [Streptomyces kronopolitis]